MEKIKLYTRDGGYVVTIVAPVFNPMAEVITWGERVFVKRLDGKYYEGMAWPADVNKEFEEFEDEEKPQPKPEYRTGFDYGNQLPDGQFEKHPTIPTAGVEFVRPLRHSYKHLKCGGVTSMGDAIARTYAAKPTYYGGTFCSTCRDYFRFKTDGGDFVWIDEDTKEATTETVGQ